MFFRSDHLTLIWFLTNFKFTLDSNDFPERPAVRSWSHFINETFANVLNSCICATYKYSSIASSEHNVVNGSGKTLPIFPERTELQVEKFATFKADAKFEISILQYMQSANMLPR